MDTKQQILIFDGPDMCGKTEIAHYISRERKIPYFKAASETGTFLHNQSKFLTQLQVADPRMLDFLKQTKHSVIFDRAYPSEWVYSRFFGRTTDDDMLTRLDMEYSILKAKLIICRRSSYEGIVDNLNASIDADKLVDLDELYMQFADWTDLDTLILNVDDEDILREADDIHEFLRK
jgi:hypothetical protein